MKNLLLAFCVLAVTAHAQISNRIAYFYPSEQRIQLYVSEEGLDRSEPVNVANLSPGEQDGINAAMTWLGSQLPAGVTTVTRVILEPGAPIPLAFDGNGNATSWARSLDASVTGRGEKGEKTLPPIKGAEVPPEILAGLLAIWDALEAAQNP